LAKQHKKKSFFLSPLSLFFISHHFFFLFKKLGSIHTASTVPPKFLLLTSTNPLLLLSYLKNPLIALAVQLNLPGPQP
tara:strand:- start:205 stop:438 length:234 start_codon:yes stop_codon:yes gene_type:complete